MAATLYGFKACDTVRKARAWLDGKGVKHRFQDWRVEPLDGAIVDGWFSRAGWETVFNRGSAAFRELPEEEKAAVNEKKAKALILANGNFVKRPVLDTGDRLEFGFKPASYEAFFAKT